MRASPWANASALLTSGPGAHSRVINPLSISGAVSNVASFASAPSMGSRTRPVSRSPMISSRLARCSSAPSRRAIALVKGVPPILAQRIKWYSDPLFRTAPVRRASSVLGWVLILAVLALVQALLDLRRPAKD